MSEPIKPWEERTEFERRRIFRECVKDFREMGYSAAEAYRLAVLSEEWADEIVERTPGLEAVDVGERHGGRGRLLSDDEDPIPS